MTSPRKGRRAVIGVDVGTLSGRAVVVSVGDAAAYDPLYAEYATLYDYFGRGTNDVMRRLRALQRKAGRD